MATADVIPITAHPAHHRVITAEELAERMKLSEERARTMRGKNSINDDDGA